MIIADDLASGFDALLQNTFDIILLDFFLPDSTGIESVKELRAKYPQIPVVLITGYDSKETALKLIDAGAQDYLIKNLKSYQPVENIYLCTSMERVDDVLEDVS